MKLVPLGEKVVVRRLEAEEMTAEDIVQRIFDQIEVA